MQTNVFLRGSVVFMLSPEANWGYYQFQTNLILSGYCSVSRIGSPPIPYRSAKPRSTDPYAARRGRGVAVRLLSIPIGLSIISPEFLFFRLSLENPYYSNERENRWEWLPGNGCKIHRQPAFSKTACSEPSL